MKFVFLHLLALISASSSSSDESGARYQKSMRKLQEAVVERDIEYIEKHIGYADNEYSYNLLKIAMDVPEDNSQMVTLLAKLILKRRSGWYAFKLVEVPAITQVLLSQNVNVENVKPVANIIDFDPRKFNQRSQQLITCLKEGYQDGFYLWALHQLNDKLQPIKNRLMSNRPVMVHRPDGSNTFWALFISSTVFHEPQNRLDAFKLILDTDPEALQIFTEDALLHECMLAIIPRDIHIVDCFRMAVYRGARFDRERLLMLARQHDEARNKEIISIFENDFEDDYHYLLRQPEAFASFYQ